MERIEIDVFSDILISLIYIIPRKPYFYYFLEKKSCIQKEMCA